MHNQRPLWPQPDMLHHVVQTSRGPVDVSESGPGRPLLYFHGTGAGNDIVPVMEHTLVEDRFRLIIFNRPGYYGTPLSCGKTPAECADLAAELLDRLDINSVGVIGTSGGGPAAFTFAARHAERTRALVLQGAMSHPFASRHWLPHKLLWAGPLFRFHRLCLPILRFGLWWEMRKLRRNPLRVIKDMSGKRYSEIANDPATRSLAEYLSESELRCAQQPAGIENDWLIAVGPPWLTPGSVTSPTLILHDQADPLVPLAHAMWALQCIPDATFCNLHAGGHLIWVGQDSHRMRETRTAFLRSHFR